MADIADVLVDDDKYDIREDGTIWKWWPRKGWKQTGLSLKNGYPHLRYMGQTVYVHRAVYKKFHGELEDGKLVHHLDGNKCNNNPDNLVQVSYSDNTKAWTDSRILLSADKVDEIKTEFTGKHGEISRLATKYNVSRDTIYRALGYRYGATRRVRHTH